MGDEMKNKVEIFNRGDTDVVVGTVDGKTTLPPQARIAFDAEFGIMVAPPGVFEEEVASDTPMAGDDAKGQPVDETDNNL